jgi:hypothetical protein
MVNTLFSNASTFVSMNSTLTGCIPLHCSIRQMCPLGPYLYVLATDTLEYLSESARMQGRIRGISLLNGSKMINNHFTNDSLLLVRLGRIQWRLLEVAMVSEWKTNYWSNGLDHPLACILSLWKWVKPGVIV